MTKLETLRNMLLTSLVSDNIFICKNTLLCSVLDQHIFIIARLCEVRKTSFGEYVHYFGGFQGQRDLKAWLLALIHREQYPEMYFNPFEWGEDSLDNAFVNVIDLIMDSEEDLIDYVSVNTDGCISIKVL